MKIAYSGICGSDLHASVGEHPFVPLPATPGHEFSGWVEECGEGVTGFKKGDRVTAEPNLVCGECYLCRIGRYNICEHLRVMGCQGDGAMADYFLLPAAKTVPIPDALSLKHAALVEPLAVGVHAVRRAGDLFGQNVVIVGAGTIGLMVLACVVEAGARSVVVTDLNESRLALAKLMGATETINAGQVDAVQEILAERPYEGIDVVFECVGIELSLRNALDLARKGGKVIVVGVFGHETKVKAANIQDRETEVIGTLMYVMRDIQDAIRLLAQNKLPADQIISAVFPLDQCNEAFAEARNTQKNIKVLFEINGE
jgi:2-desacetyl-2-hydroxyethyl bacteriochlorophyllide A dehydrogenase